MKRLLPILFLFGCGTPQQPCPVVAPPDTIRIESTQNDTLAIHYEEILEIKELTIYTINKQNQTLKQENENLQKKLDSISIADIHRFFKTFSTTDGVLRPDTNISGNDSPN